MEHFIYNERLQIYLPDLQEDFYHLPEEERSKIVTQWEIIRSTIPDKIKLLDKMITEKQILLANESNLVDAYQINEDIAVLASIVNDLWIWFRS